MSFGLGRPWICCSTRVWILKYWKSWASYFKDFRKSSKWDVISTRYGNAVRRNLKIKKNVAVEVIHATGPTCSFHVNKLMCKTLSSPTQEPVLLFWLFWFARLQGINEILSACYLRCLYHVSYFTGWTPDLVKWPGSPWVPVAQWIERPPVFGRSWVQFLSGIPARETRSAAR